MSSHTGATTTPRPRYYRATDEEFAALSRIAAAGNRSAAAEVRSLVQDHIARHDRAGKAQAA